MPCNLSDAVLLQIARDLRLVEISCTVDESVVPPIAGPLYLLLHMFGAKTDNSHGKRYRVTSISNIELWMQRYMHYVEREIVSRAVKMPCHEDSHDLMAEIQHELHIAQ